MTTSIIARVNDVDILLFKGEKELIPIKPICMALGIDFASQFQKIVIHPILRNVVYKEYMVGADNKKRKMICMPLDHILIWLLSICYKNVNKDAIKPLLTTQMNLYYILYKRIQMSYVDIIGYQLFVVNTVEKWMCFLLAYGRKPRFNVFNLILQEKCEFEVAK